MLDCLLNFSLFFFFFKSYIKVLEQIWLLKSKRIYGINNLVTSLWYFLFYSFTSNSDIFILTGTRIRFIKFFGQIRSISLLFELGCWVRYFFITEESQWTLSNVRRESHLVEHFRNNLGDVFFYAVWPRHLIIWEHL